MQEEALKRVLEESHKEMFDDKKPEKRLNGVIPSCLEKMRSHYDKETQAEEYARLVAVLPNKNQLNAVVRKLLGSNYADGEHILTKSTANFSVLFEETIVGCLTLQFYHFPFLLQLFRV